MKLFFIIIIAIYIIIIAIDLYYTLKNYGSIGDLILRVVLIHPIYILWIVIIVFIEMNKPRIYKESDLYGIKSCFNVFAPPHYINITKDQKIIDYNYEIDCDYERYKAKEEDVFFLTDKSNKLSIWCDGIIVTGDSLICLTKNIILGKESQPIDVVVVFKGEEKDTLKFLGQSLFPLKIDTIKTCSPAMYGE
ncbi:hypothetical protein [Dysgonomonas sp. 37-18]|uniref:hypothetical protein n=1 Tax=Dysgonomonas sp. 37-18 TaxID=1895907 RepID=UPI000928F006|nr:hypothetical protein [Dysgonomonas sp. 37-18]OJX62459.1 MAG: hypothetical protein BGO84_14630 [Dysgonomonas sp. 37-18]